MTECSVKVNYSDLLDLGFKKIEINDHIHEKQFGYPYYVLFYGEDNDQVNLEWSPVDRVVSLYINSHTYQTGLTLDDVKKVIGMLKDEI